MECICIYIYQDFHSWRLWGVDEDYVEEVEKERNRISIRVVFEVNDRMDQSGKEWEFHFRTLSSLARDSNFPNDPASDPSLLNSVYLFPFSCIAFKYAKLGLICNFFSSFELVFTGEETVSIV